MAGVFGYSLPYYLLLLISATLFITVSSSCPSKHECHDCLVKTKQISHLIIFGDSYYNVAKPSDNCVPSKLWPYGKTIFETTGRFSDGEIVPDFISKQLGLSRVEPYEEGSESKPDFKTSHANGINFAMAGAGSKLLNNINAADRKDLEHQKELYMKVLNKLPKQGGGALHYPSDNTLYLISIGRHDYMREINEGGLLSNNDASDNSVKVTQIVKGVMSKIEVTIKAIHDEGRSKGKYFGFQNMGPLDLLPIVRRDFEEKMDVLQKLATEHNRQLQETLSKLQRTYKQNFGYSILDYYTAITDATSIQKGFTEDKNACCGDGSFNGDDCGTMDKEGCDEPEKHVFWDGIHNTHKFNAFLGDAFWNGRYNLTINLSLKKLVSAGQSKIKLSSSSV